MSNGSINIDDIEGEVSGVVLGGTGNISGKKIVVNGPLVIINNPTKEDYERMRNVKQIPLEASSVKEQLTTQQVEEAKRSIDWFKNLLTVADRKAGTQTQAIRAGNLEISRVELLRKDELFSKLLIAKSPEELGAFRDPSIRRTNDYSSELIVATKDIRRAYELERLGRYNEAIQYYDKAIQRVPDYVGALQNKGVALGKLGRYNEAIQCLEKALKINPSVPGLWYHIGQNLEKLGRFYEAEQHSNKARQIQRYLESKYGESPYGELEA